MTNLDNRESGEADWAINEKGKLTPLDEISSPEEVVQHIRQFDLSRLIPRHLKAAINDRQKLETDIAVALSQSALQAKDLIDAYVTELQQIVPELEEARDRAYEQKINYAAVKHDSAGSLLLETLSKDIEDINQTLVSIDELLKYLDVEAIKILTDK